MKPNGSVPRLEAFVDVVLSADLVVLNIFGG